ncbi:MAG: hypothetical protein PHC34_11025 [Candidatus Gastranaerophilales bacterium]|nr:hypothetical protein [Candidatus Gastranaerophilales bacterium]
MNKSIKIIKKQIKKFYEDNFDKIIEINEKYANPKIEMSPIVKFTLLILKFYLLFIMGLLIYKFITLLK